ncbi:MAG: HdeD family acid-resistance protein [Nitrososphaeraceae archaeon]
MQTLQSPPPWLRMLQIVLGGLCVILSVAILAYIGPAILITILILSVILLAVGIERAAVGIALRRSSRRSSITNIVLGLAIVAFSIVLMQFPIFTSAVLVILAAVALLLSGIARIMHGISSERTRSSRAFLMGVGVISIAVSILVIAHPISFGLVLFGIFISIAFLISGIEMMALGISGRQEYLAPTTDTQ